MQLTFTVELGNQIALTLLPAAFKMSLPKQVPLLIVHKQFVSFANIYLDNNIIKANADIPEELFNMAPVPVFEVDEEEPPVANRPATIIKASILSIGLMPHKPGDTIQSISLQLINHMAVTG